MNTKLAKLWCKVVGHDWRFHQSWEPSIDAEIVTAFTHTCVCVRCGYTEEDTMHFDATTGTPIEYPADDYPCDENCSMCDGEACLLWGAGCWDNSVTNCEHAVDERHMRPEDTNG